MTHFEDSQSGLGPGIEANALLLSNLLKQLPFPVWIFDENFELVHDNGNWGWLAPAMKASNHPLRNESGLGKFLRDKLQKCFHDQHGGMHQGWVDIEQIGHCYILFHFLPVQDGLMACIPIDLTAAKQVEELLFSSETKYRTLVEAMRDGVWVHNTGLVITFCNDGLCRMLGMPRSELLGKSITELAPAVAPADLHKLIEDSSGVHSQPVEVELLVADGSSLTACISSTAVTSSTGSGTDYFAVVTDISDQRKTHQALLESERRYRAVAEDQTELICRFDEVGNLTFTNQAYQRFVGNEAGQALGGFFIQTLPEEEVTAVDQFIERVLASESGSSIEHRVIMDDGSTRWLQWNARVVSGSAPAWEIQAVGRDITERKVYYQEILNYQDQLRRMSSELILAEDRERRRIASGLQDEIGKTLASALAQLTTVAAKAELAGNRGITESLELLSQAQESCQQLTFELSPPVHHEEGFVSALEWLVDEIAERYGIQTEFFDDLNSKPITDDARIQVYQAVRGVLYVLAQQEGIERISLSAKLRGAEVSIGVAWEFTKDGAQGPGARFLGLDGTGLFSIRERLGQIGGRADYQITRDGSGNLNLTVPAKAIEGGRRTKQPRVATRSMESHQEVEQIKVLLVDAQVMMREGIRSLLQRDSRIEISGETGDGLEALELAVQQRPDIILMDSSLPGLGSAQTLARIRPVLPVTAVIAMSQTRNRENICEMLKAGATGFILKDCAHQDLITAINTVMSGQRYLSPDVLESILGDYVNFAQRSAAVKPSVLTTRELEVLGMLSDGLSTKEIARKLNLSVKTVETHRRRISVKLGITSIAELTKYAIREGIRNLDDK